MIERNLPSLLSKAMKRLSKKCQIELVKAGLCEAINTNFRQSLGPMVAHWNTPHQDGKPCKTEYEGVDVYHGSDESVIEFPELEEAFEGTDFGEGMTDRQRLENGVLKLLCGYSNGSTLTGILEKLKLIKVSKIDDPQTFPYATVIIVTKKGKKFLYEALDSEPKMLKPMLAKDIVVGGTSLEELGCDEPELSRALKEVAK